MPWFFVAHKVRLSHGSLASIELVINYVSVDLFHAIQYEIGSLPSFLLCRETIKAAVCCRHLRTTPHPPPVWSRNPNKERAADSDLAGEWGRPCRPPPSLGPAFRMVQAAEPPFVQNGQGLLYDLQPSSPPATAHYYYYRPSHDKIRLVIRMSPIRNSAGYFRENKKLWSDCTEVSVEHTVSKLRNRSWVRI